MKEIGGFNIDGKIYDPKPDGISVCGVLGLLCVASLIASYFFTSGLCFLAGLAFGALAMATSDSSSAVDSVNGDGNLCTHVNKRAAAHRF